MWRVSTACLLLVPALGWGAEARLGEWRASYTVYDSRAEVCEAQPQWLADELQSVNALLAGFLNKSASHNGAWNEADLPLLEQAVKVLPAMVSAQLFALESLERCELRTVGLFPSILARGLPLAKDAKAQLERLPDLVRFAKHRVVIERWEKDRLDQVARARAACRGAKPAETRIYFAYEDEFGARRWLLCDESVVLAPPGKAWEHLPSPGAPHDLKRATQCIQAARLFSEGSMLHAPKP
jgi:hypothetical protein